MGRGNCVYFMGSDEGVGQPKETQLNLFYVPCSRQHSCLPVFGRLSEFRVLGFTLDKDQRILEGPSQRPSYCCCGLKAKAHV